jgi:L,D-transpeptidase ErfK/SrfK
LIIIIFTSLEVFILTIFITLSLISSVHAQAFSYSKNNTVIGLTKNYIVKENESLIEIARKFGLGYNEIIRANPGLDPFVPGPDSSITLPTSWVLPDMESYNGVVINLSEMRLYYFFMHSGSRLVMTFPIGIGREGYETPVGKFKVVEKILNPRWHVPESIRKEKPRLPKVVRPGHDNPLGSHALRLSMKNILIHGTHMPYGVGRRVSYGCIRLYPEDIKKLFEFVPNRTEVYIVRQPVKVGTINDEIYIEVHKDEYLKMNYFDEAVRLLRKKNLYEMIDKEKMISTLREKKGIPLNIIKHQN